MDNSGSNNFGLLLLGSGLTFLASIVIEVLKNYFSRRNLKKNFTLYVKVELDNVSKSVQTLKTLNEHIAYRDFFTINKAQQSLTYIDSLRKDSIYLKKDLQKDFIDLISDLSNYFIDIRATDSFETEQNKNFSERKKDQNDITASKDNADFEKFINNKKISQNNDLSVLERRIDEFIKKIE